MSFFLGSRIDTINSAATHVIKSPEFVRRMNEFGFEIMRGTPEQIPEMIRAEAMLRRPLVKELGIKAE